MASKGSGQLGPLARLRQAIQESLFGSVAQSAATSVGIKAGLPSPIGINFSASCMKILQIMPGNPPSLLAAVSLETPENLINDPERRLAFQFEALGKLAKHGGFRGRRAVCSLPPWLTFCKPLQVPRQDGVPMATLVNAAIQSQLNCDPTSIVYRYYEVTTGEKSSGKTDVLVVATPRDVVERLMSVLSTAKLEPVGLHSEFAGLLRAFDYVHRREGDLQVNTLYLDIGATTTNVVIAHSTELAFARVVQIGGRHLDEAIAKHEAITPREARTRRLAAERIFPTKSAPEPEAVVVGGVKDVFLSNRREGAGLCPGFTGDVLSQPPAVVGPPDCKELQEVLDTLTDEIRLCMRYHSAQFPQRKVERAIFVGGESGHRGLCQHIARALRLSAQTADPMARIARTGKEPAIGVDLKEPQPAWAVTLGLCLAPTDL